MAVRKEIREVYLDDEIRIDAVHDAPLVHPELAKLHEVTRCAAVSGGRGDLSVSADVTAEKEYLGEAARDASRARRRTSGRRPP